MQSHVYIYIYTYIYIYIYNIYTYIYIVYRKHSIHTVTVIRIPAAITSEVLTP